MPTYGCRISVGGFKSGGKSKLILRAFFETFESWQIDQLNTPKEACSLVKGIRHSLVDHLLKGFLSLNIVQFHFTTTLVEVPSLLGLNSLLVPHRVHWGASRSLEKKDKMIMISAIPSFPEKIRTSLLFLTLSRAPIQTGFSIENPTMNFWTCKHWNTKWVEFGLEMDSDQKSSAESLRKPRSNPGSRMIYRTTNFKVENPKVQN